MLTAWDINARKRHSQILEGKDISFSEVLIPKLLEQIENIPDRAMFSVLDVGCGTAVLTRVISVHFRHVVGIDPSQESIRIAREYVGKSANVIIECATISEFAKTNRSPFDLSVANMTLQAIELLPPALASISNVLKPGGAFIFSVPHPCFWANHRSEIVSSGYRYYAPASYEIPFTISNDPEPLPSPIPYYHRSLEAYSTELYDAGFTIEKIYEPFPDSQLMAKYPTQWQYPRFIIFNCRKRLTTEVK